MTGHVHYRFEHRLIAWAEELTTRLAGGRCALFIGLREHGSLRRIYFAVPGDTIDGERKAALAEAYPRWFLYTPGLSRGTGYIEWLGLEREVAARWLGTLTDDDLRSVQADAARTAWPTAWRALVGCGVSAAGPAAPRSRR